MKLDEILSIFAEKYLINSLLGGLILLIIFYLKFIIKINTQRDNTELALADRFAKNFEDTKELLQNRVEKLEEAHNDCQRDFLNLKESFYNELKESAEERMNLKITIAKLDLAITALKEEKEKIIVTAGEHGVIKEVQGSCLSMLFWTPEELIGKDIDILIPINEKLNHHNAYTKRMNTDEELSAKLLRESYALRKDGTTIPVVIEVSTYTTYSGNRMATATIMRRI